MAYAIHITFWRYKADSMKTYTLYSEHFRDQQFVRKFQQNSDIIEMVVISFIKVFITFSKLHVSIEWMKLILTKSFTKTLFMLPNKTELILIIKSAPQSESIQGQFHVLVSATKLLQWSTYNACLSDEIDEWSCRKRWKLRFFKITNQNICTIYSKFQWASVVISQNQHSNMENGSENIEELHHRKIVKENPTTTKWSYSSIRSTSRRLECNINFRFNNTLKEKWIQLNVKMTIITVNHLKIP